MSENSKLSGAINLLDRAMRWVSLVFGGTTLAVMTVFSVWNVLIMRKGFNSPITGAEDVLILMLVAIVALSIPLGARTGGHIEIEIMEPHMSANFAKWSSIIVKVMGIALLVFMSWRLWHAGQSAARFGETTQQLLISYEYFYYALAVSVAVYALVLCLDVGQLLKSGKVTLFQIDGDRP
jgi:TRAP-type C4-dicarboxylate transport system permease small subunit